MEAKKQERFGYEKRISYSETDPSKITYLMWIIYDRERNAAVHFHGRAMTDMPDLSLYDAREIRRGPHAGLWFSPRGIEIHSPAARYEGQRPLGRPCSVLCGPCYPDGTSLGGSRFAEHWSGSDDEVWGELRGWARRDDVEEDTAVQAAAEGKT